jgi:hypothetical protein
MVLVTDLVVFPSGQGVTIEESTLCQKRINVMPEGGTLKHKKGLLFECLQGMCAGTGTF